MLLSLLSFHAIQVQSRWLPKRMYSSSLKAVTRSSSSSSSAKLFQFSHNGLDYCIRQAQHADLESIDSCNRANLPENYSPDFYLDQIRYFPELTLIAETVESREVIGYALGQIRVKPQHTIPPMDHFNPKPKEYEGHVTSIAIHEKFRGHKVGLNLMHTLHQRIAKEYGIDRVSLYCRVSA